MMAFLRTVALAAGRLESRELSHRVKVWAEPEVVEAAAFEFSETEDFLSAAESITCPYVWTRYDVLCLPPSFPYGGMENPCLTFATPTLLAGDKSLADVIAHEIAHSWTGNFVTNATWEHFWLNEGWTVWLERKIIAK
jgi:leukotriene-A4 hydrolase